MTHQSTGRFANHSCDPNCEVEKWTVNGVDHLVVVATKEIMPKEEITHNYDFELYDAAPQQVHQINKHKFFKTHEMPFVHHHDVMI